MTRTPEVEPPRPVDPHGRQVDWDEAFPADPDLMKSAEGDTAGLAELRRAARARLDRARSDD